MDVTPRKGKSCDLGRYHYFCPMQNSFLVFDAKIIHSLTQILPEDRYSYRIIIKAHGLLDGFDVEKMSFLSNNAVDRHMIFRWLGKSDGLNDWIGLRNSAMGLNDME